MEDNNIKDELDLLNNILLEKMNILQEDPYCIEITINSDIEKPQYLFILTIKIPDDYPNIIPTYTIVEKNNKLTNNNLKELNDKINSLCNDQIGMPMMYQMYESVLTYADEQEEKLIEIENKMKKEEEDKILLEKKLQEEKEKLLEDRNYTPVTEELFNEWYKNYKKKMATEKSKSDLEGKLTGRMIFLNKNLNINEEDIKEEEEDKNVIKEEDNVENEELFEEDIGNIDFDQDDSDIKDK